MILRPHRGQHRCAQRRHRDRTRVVRVVLVGTTGPQHPHSRRERRGNIEHRLTRREELLREKIAEPTRGLDRPRPILEPIGPREQLHALTFTRPHLQPRELDLAAIDRDRGVRRLVRIHSDHHRHRDLLLVWMRDRSGHS